MIDFYRLVTSWFFENYLTSDFHTNIVISRRACLHIKMASKTVIRSTAARVQLRFAETIHDHNFNFILWSIYAPKVSRVFSGYFVNLFLKIATLVEFWISGHKVERIKKQRTLILERKQSYVGSTVRNMEGTGIPSIITMNVLLLMLKLLLFVSTG